MGSCERDISRSSVMNSCMWLICFLLSLVSHQKSKHQCLSWEKVLSLDVLMFVRAPVLKKYHWWSNWWRNLIVPDESWETFFSFSFLIWTRMKWKNCVLLSPDIFNTFIGTHGWDPVPRWEGPSGQSLTYFNKTLLNHILPALNHRDSLGKRNSSGYLPSVHLLTHSHL